ncbi:MAG: sulfite exporter TauE/SafE family protein [Hyphomicrobiales bacterium]|nr:sulfite exporter TauE/SafE family protein [Hyphomicrobiales bacterium]
MVGEVGLLAGFGAGLASFLSPCILPLVPPYLCFLAGASLDEITTGGAVADRALVRALAFVLGFTCVFVALGASASTLGQLVSEHLTALSRTAGVIIVLLGLQMVGVLRIGWLMREARFQAAARPAGLVGAFVVGLAFGFGWTPCVGPVLASILLVAGTEASATRGAALLAAYAAGIGIPFLVAALFMRSFLAAMARLRRYLPMVETAMGLLLVATGVLIFTGSMPVVGGWLLEHVPLLGRIG